MPDTTSDEVLCTRGGQRYVDLREHYDFIAGAVARHAPGAPTSGNVYLPAEINTQVPPKLDARLQGRINDRTYVEVWVFLGPDGKAKESLVVCSTDRFLNDAARRSAMSISAVPSRLDGRATFTVVPLAFPADQFR
ncbi:hypothetical protein [Silanimonas sp.]|jgi:hypothetical protein|uniref:hypothetical protein n=1 Tax=Silanimonas sp. TaxID=1929290 RepID=UPI0022C8171F|nr:hypothetical protein [Silanimonas sp.]MCZ8115329.1 hypothetical protein [Silanimonas sp.]